MMSARWEIWLDNSRGGRLKILDEAAAWEIVRSVNQVGSFQVILPGDFNHALLLADGMVEFWRAPEGGALRWLTTGLITDIEYADDESGLETIRISGPDAIDLLRRRVIAYAGTAQASKTDQADDMLKEIVRENFSSLASDTARDLTLWGFSVAANLGLAPTITKSFAWRNVLKALQEITEASRQAGTRLYFDLVQQLVSQAQISFTFETYVNQRGVDHSSASKDPIYFGKKWGNLQGAKYQLTRRESANYAYVGGQGQGTDRQSAEISDAADIAISPWNRREMFVDARNEASASALQDRGRAAIAAERPRAYFSGTLLDAEQTVFGRDWGFGDRVVCQHRGMEFDAEVRAYRLRMNDDGQEKLDVKVEAEL